MRITAVMTSSMTASISKPGILRRARMASLLGYALFVDPSPPPASHHIATSGERAEINGHACCDDARC